MKAWFVFVSLCAIGLATHLLPHDMGVSTLGMLGMLGAAYLPRAWVALPVCLVVAVSDYLAGGYALQAMAIVYLAHIFASIGVVTVLRHVSAMTVAQAALVSAVIFYLISNLTPMVMGYYDNTLAGWVTCYVNGLPYLLRGVLANLVFGGAAFGIVTFVGRRYAHRIATS